MRKSLIVTLMLVSYLVSSCGTLFYPERRGNASGRLDPAVVVLDGIGLLFFIIPGVIAFAVDLSTGCIYLGGGRSRLAYTDKIMLDKNQDMFAQVNQILLANYQSSLNNAIMLN